ncbi:adhesion domain-containing protein, partial [Serratia fonticola]
GGSIMMTVTASKAGVPIPGAVISFATTGTVDRQGNTGGWTGSNGPLQLNAANIGSRTFTTGDNGRVDIPVTHPKGLGVKTTIEATAVPGVTATTDVTFAIVTSPDTPLANMYGHMSDTLTAGGKTFMRPTLDIELAGDVSFAYKGEIWAGYTHESAIGRVCSSGANLPSKDDLIGLFEEYGTRIADVHGWPVSRPPISSPSYRSSTPSNAGHHMVDLANGSLVNGNSDLSSGRVTCSQ